MCSSTKLITYLDCPCVDMCLHEIRCDLWSSLFDCTPCCSFRAHVLRIRQRPDALPEYYMVNLEYFGHITSFGMAGMWWKLEEGVKEPSKEQAGAWAMYPVQKKSAVVNRPINRATTGENGQQSGWNMYEL